MLKRMITLLSVMRLFSCPQPFAAKLRLLLKVLRSRRHVVSATGFVEQLTIVIEILKSDVPGIVVECGAYQGASSIALSLACALTGRKLYICDSFAGLPQPDEHDRQHAIVRDAQIASYEKGAWYGSLDLVRENIAQYGTLSVCTFVQGYFEETLPQFREQVAVAFCDVDLLGSLKTCVEYLWPVMSDRAVLFTHEAHHHEIASLFYDNSWWCKLGTQAPGLIGGGNGLGLSLLADGTIGSCLGYTVKHPVAVTRSSEIGKDETTYEECHDVLIR